MNVFVLRANTDNKEAKALALKLASPLNIYNFVKDCIKYTKDPIWQSWRTPDETISAKKGDCVDKTLLSKTMLDTIGIQNRMIISYKNTEPQEAHIYNQILNRYWEIFDTSCGICAMGNTFAHNWEIVAIIYDDETFIFNNKKYRMLI